MRGEYRSEEVAAQAYCSRRQQCRAGEAFSDAVRDAERATSIKSDKTRVCRLLTTYGGSVGVREREMK